MVLESGWEFDIKQSILYFIVKKTELPSQVILKGPPVRARADAKKFKSKHKKVFEKNQRLYAQEKRKYKKPDKFVKDLIKGEYINQRVAKIKVGKGENNRRVSGKNKTAHCYVCREFCSRRCQRKD